MVPELLAWSLRLAPATAVPPPPDPLELELDWRAPAGCPTQADIERRLAELLPGDPAGEGVLHIRGVVTVDGAGARLALTSSFRGVTERRELTSADCGELGEATAVWLAVALEPDANVTTGRTPAPVVATPPTDDPIDAALLDVDPMPSVDPVPSDDRIGGSPRSPAAPARRSLAPDLGLRIATGIEVGALPPPAAAVQLAGLLLWPRARLEIHGTYLAPRSQSDASGRGAQLQLGAAGVRGCGRLFARDVEFPLCVGGEAGAIRARALGGRDAVVNGRWAAAIASAGVARAWGPVAIWFAVEGLGRLVGTRFLVGETFSARQSPVSGRALLGIELRGSWNRGARGQ